MRKRTFLLLSALFSAAIVSAQVVLKYDDPNGLSYENRTASSMGNVYAGYMVVAPSAESGNQDHYKGNVVIPDSITVNGVKYNVLGIGSEAFSGCTDLTSVVISNVSNGVTIIERFAFDGCTNLTSVSLPSSTYKIGHGAFNRCTGLTEMTIPEGVREIEEFAFSDCSNLTSVTIPSTVIRITRNPFPGCYNLGQIIVAPSNYYFDSRSNCNAIISSGNNTLIAGCKNTIIPSTISTIGEYAFQGSGLTTIDIPTGVADICFCAFIDCNFLTTVNIPSSVGFIEGNVFGRCSQLSSISVDPDNKIYDSRENCNAIIESVDSTVYSKINYDGIPYYNMNTSKNHLVIGCKNTVIPNSVTSIKAAAFSGCSELESFVLPLNVVNMGEGVFAGCTGLTSLSVAPNHPVYDSRDNCNAIIETVSNTLIAGCSSTTIPNSVSGIADYAFMDFSNLTSIVFPYGITSIGNGSFRGCTNLESVNLPSSLSSILSEAFYNCSALTSIDIPSSVRIIGDAFAYCSSLGSVTFHSGQPDTLSISGIAFFSTSPQEKVLFIPEGSYYAYKNNYWTSYFDEIRILDDEDRITIDEINYRIISTDDRTASVAYGDYKGNIDIPAKVPVQGVDYSVVGIGDEAFLGCKELESVTLPDGLQTIGAGAFAESGLTSLSIPQGITRIENSLFRGCTSLISTEIPSSVGSIGEYAFYDCSSLQSLILPEGVTHIDKNNVFYGCKSLSYLSLPSTLNIEYISGHPLFSGCEGLKTAGPNGGGYNLEFTLDTIPAAFFEGMNGLESVYIPKTVKLFDANRYFTTNITDIMGNSQSVYATSFFYGCTNLKSIAISFSDTKIPRKKSYPMIYYTLADYNIYIGTPIHSITFLDDTIKYALEYGRIDEIGISGNVMEISPGILDQAGYLESVMVEGANQKFSSLNGVLFSKDGRELLTYPVARSQSEYIIPDQVTKIADYAFNKNGLLQSVTIPESVETIGTKAFEKCQSLKSVTIKGAPLIDTLAFINCNNIETVTSWSATPQGMSVFDTPQTIMVGGYEDINSNGMDVTSEYNPVLGRKVSLISKSGTDSWDCIITTTDVPAGKYRVSMGILPSPDNRPNYIHPIIIGVTENGEEVLLDSMETKSVEIRPGRFRDVTQPYYFTNNLSGYDSVTIVNSLDILQAFNKIKIYLQSKVSSMNIGVYSGRLLLDRIFFEPLDKDIPAERYAGPFTESVFNNATLYVPDGAISSYQTADGWKMFKNIEVDTAVDPVFKDNKDSNNIGDAVIYDITGRRLKAESIELLNPGLYIINDRKYLIK